MLVPIKKLHSVPVVVVLPLVRLSRSKNPRSLSMQLPMMPNGVEVHRLCPRTLGRRCSLLVLMPGLKRYCRSSS